MYNNTLFTVVETPEFIDTAAGIWADEEREAFIGWIAANPDAGEVIRRNIMSNGKKMDAETAALLASIERGLQQALAGEGRVTTGEEIAKRTAGRPPLAVHKKPVTLRLDPGALARWRASGKGWQTRAAAVLAAHAPA
jgi:uncharacterized protein (DUF4415 family)